MRMRVAMEPDSEGVASHSSRSSTCTYVYLDLFSLAYPPVFLVMMVHNSQLQVHVGSNSMTVSK